MHQFIKKFLHSNTWSFFLLGSIVFLTHAVIVTCIYFHRIVVIATNYGIPNLDTDGTLWYDAMRLFTQNNHINMLYTNKLVAFPFGYDVTYIPYYSLIYEIELFFMHFFGSTWQSIIIVTNVSTLLAHVLTGVTSFFLIYYFIKNKYIAFIGSCIFCYTFYYIMMSATSLSLDHYEFIPLYFLSLFYFLDKRKLWTLFISSLIFTIMFSANAYWAFFCGLFSFPILLFYGKSTIHTRIKVIIFYYVILFLVLVLTQLSYIQTQLYNFNLKLLVTSGKHSTASQQLQNFLWFFSPARKQFLYPWGKAGSNVGNGFLGYTSLALGFFGLLTPIRKEKNYLLFLFLFVISILITVNIPPLEFLNEIYFKYFSEFRSITRVSVFTSFFLSLIGAYTLQYILQTYKLFQKKIITICFLLTLILLIILESLNTNKMWYRTTDFAQVAKLYAPIKNNPHIHAIVTYPAELSDTTSGFPPNYDLLGQIIYQKPLANGASPFLPKTILYNTAIQDIGNPQTITTLTKYGVDTIIIHPNLLKNPPLMKQLKFDKRLQFLGEYSAVQKNVNYTVGFDTAETIDVFLIKQASLANDKVNKSSVMISPTHSKFTASKNSATKYSVTVQTSEKQMNITLAEPYTKDWVLYAKQNTGIFGDIRYLFTRSFPAKHLQSFPNNNTWMIHFPKKSNNQQSFVILYRPALITFVENTISTGVYLIIIAIIMISFLITKKKKEY